MSDATVEFHVAGGKPDGGETNWKYCDSSNSFAEALDMFLENAEGYPIREMIAVVGGRRFDITPIEKKREN